MSRAMSMQLTRRAVMLACVAVLAAWSAGRAAAEDFPTRPIRIVSIHPAGIATDPLARALAPSLGQALGQSVVVENRPGGNGIVATTAVAKAQPDGYTLLITSGAHVANAFVEKSLPYDPLADFVPVTQLAGSYGLALMTNLPVTSVADLVALAKQKPGELSYATNGVGNVTHLAGLLLEARSGIKMIAVPYNTPNLMTDVMAGHVSMTFISTATATPLIESGKAHALAITGPKRAPNLPNVPTLQELGYAGFDITGYFGLLAPAHTPPDRIERLYRAAATALAAPDVKRIMDAGGFYAVGSTPAEFASFLKKDYAYQSQLMDEFGLKAK